MTSDLKFPHYTLAQQIDETSVDLTMLACRFNPDESELLFEIKVFKPQLALGAIIEKVKIDAEMARKVKNPSLAAFIELGFEKGFHYIVRETLEGISLKELCLRTPDRKQIDGKSFLFILSKVASALASLERAQHSQEEEINLIKDAVFAANIAVDFQGKTKLVEFGPFRICSDVNAITTKQESIFSFGMLFWAFFNGQDFELSRKQYENRFSRDLQRLNPAVPEDLAEFIYNCLESDTPNALRSYQEINEGLQQFVAKYAADVTVETLAQHLAENFAMEFAAAEKNREQRRKRAAVEKRPVKPTVSEAVATPLATTSNRKSIRRQFNVMNVMRTMMGAGILFVLSALWVSLVQRPGAMEAYRFSGLTKTTRYYISAIREDFKNRWSENNSKQQREPASVHKLLLLSTPRIVRVQINGDESFDTITPTKIDFPKGDEMWLKVEAQGHTPFSIIVNRKTSKITLDLGTGTYTQE